MIANFPYRVHATGFLVFLNVAVAYSSCHIFIQGGLVKQCVTLLHFLASAASGKPRLPID
jgi:hypothetical protein